VCANTHTHTHTSIQPVDLPGTYSPEIHTQNAVILVWQDSYYLGGTDKESHCRRLRGSESPVRGVAGHLCHFPYLAGPLNPFKDVVILLETEAADGRSFFLCFQMDAWCDGK